MKKWIFLLCLSLSAASISGCSVSGGEKPSREAETLQTESNSDTTELESDSSEDTKESEGEESDEDDYEEGEEVDPASDAVFGTPEKPFVEEIVVDEDGTPASEKQEAPAEDKAEADSDDTVVFKSTDNGKEVENSVKIPKSPTGGMRIQYPQKDVFSLDNTAIGWGMGPDRDEFNRPITALQYQQEYSEYNADFIIPEADPAKDKTIYLTFDEGYENGFSASILDTLKAHKARAVFFITKPYAVGNPELVQRMLDEGHILGNHTVNHPSDGMPAHDLMYQTNEVVELNDYVRDNFGYQMCLFRYPTGNFSKQSLAIVSNCGYRSVFWSFAYADWDRNNQPNPQEALSKLENSLHPGAIYLLHAVSQTNATILNDFLSYAESQGYTFGHYYDTLDH